MAALQRNQLSKLCSNAETFEKAVSILRLASAKTRPGSGFVVKNPVAIPAVCAYLASEQMNTGEVSLQSAMSAACVMRAEFTDILNKVRAALHEGEGNKVTNVTYEMLVDAYHIHPREVVIGCMEDAEAALPRVDILREKYGANILSCAVFYWACQLMEELSVQERSLCRSYSIPLKSLKAIVTILDKQCDDVADQIKSYLLQKRSFAEASTSSQLDAVSKSILISPKKSPTKSAMRSQTRTRKVLTPATTPSKKRTVTFSHLLSDGDGGYDGDTFPETPTKKRRIDTLSTKPSRSNSPVKRSLEVSTTAFYAALKGSRTKEQEGESLVTGPSTPRCPRRAMVTEVTTTPMQVQPSPSRSQGQASPSRSARRRRFRPIFLEQQQWCARDPKVERMWAVAETLRDEMLELHGHPFQRMWQRGGDGVGAT